MPMRLSQTPADAEWLEPDGQGGFASGTVSGVRTRRYHALLLTATQPPTGRVLLVNGIEAWIETGGNRYPITSHRYGSDVTYPEGASYIAKFENEPWPTWEYVLPNGIPLRQELAVSRKTGQTLIRWRVEPAHASARLFVRPLISGRDYHALHHENEVFDFRHTTRGQHVFWRPYAELPGIDVASNAVYRHDPVWYRNFAYDAERQRGLDWIEDLASPGVFEFDLAHGDACLAISAVDTITSKNSSGDAIEVIAKMFSDEAKRRNTFPNPIHRAADAYIARRGDGKTLIAGFPWFTDWGRDTFIAMRGLCLAAGRLDVARDILVAWAGTVSDGMLPNFFPDASAEPEYNTVDASLWYVIAAHELLELAKQRALPERSELKSILGGAISKILDGYANGTRYGIRAGDDGLLMAGAPGVQLTWMDARIGDWVVTPRIGKPVEIQALWINALVAGTTFSGRWTNLMEQARRSFEDRFWSAENNHLYDVIDVDHQHGKVDASLRPNQILAVGGLPFPVLTGPRARAVVDVVERELLTPLGLRTLSPNDPAYRPRYEGGPFDRDSAYHQGPVWPWLLDPFVDAWVRVHGNSDRARHEARVRFLPPVLEHLGAAGLGHVSELVDPEPPFTPRGCPFQAWSLGALIRIMNRLRDAKNNIAAPSATASLELEEMIHVK